MHHEYAPVRWRRLSVQTRFLLRLSVQGQPPSWKRRWTLRAADFVVCPSSSMAQRIRALEADISALRSELEAAKTKAAADAAQERAELLRALAKERHAMVDFMARVTQEMNVMRAVVVKLSQHTELAEDERLVVQQIIRQAGQGGGGAEAQ
jgi:hypothetical protein